MSATVANSRRASSLWAPPSEPQRPLRPASSSCWAGAEGWTRLTANRSGAGYAASWMPPTSCHASKAWARSAPLIGCGHAVVGQEEEVADLVMGGQEALGVPDRLEPLHLEVSNPLAHAALCRMPLPLHAANWATLTADVHGWPFEKRAVDRTANLDLGSRIHILHFSIIIDRAVPGNGLGLELLQAVAPRDGPPL